MPRRHAMKCLRQKPLARSGRPHFSDVQMPRTEIGAAADSPDACFAAAPSDLAFAETDGAFAFAFGADDFVGAFFSGISGNRIGGLGPESSARWVLMGRDRWLPVTMAPVS